MPDEPPRLRVAVRETKPPFALEHNRQDGSGRAGRSGRRRSGAQARILAESLLPSGAWEWGRDQDGRPRLEPAAGTLHPPDVSLAHSGAWVAAALSWDGRVGVDVERAGRDRDYPAMARACFSAEEIRQVCRDGEDAFLAFWCLREAVAKLGGGGLPTALALDGSRLVAGRLGLCEGQGWVAGHRFLDGLHLALAWAPAVPVAGAASRLAEALDRPGTVCKPGLNSL